MLLGELVAASNEVAATRSRKAKVAALRRCLDNLSSAERKIGIAYLAGETPQGRVGLGYASLAGRQHAANGEPGDTSRDGATALTLLDVDAAIDALRAATGAGSRARRAQLLDALFVRAGKDERQFLRHLLLQELRQGAQEGIMLDALAQAADADPAAVRRAVMLGGSVNEVGAALLDRGPEALDDVHLTLFRPVLPMLAQTAADVTAALERTGEASVETKFDGARIQAHRSGDRVEIYTRNLRAITAQLPEIETAVAALAVRSVVLDGEAIALRADGTPHPFQVTMSRFGSQQDDAQAQRQLALTPVFFDCLHLDGEDLIDRPLRERLVALDAACPAALRAPRTVTSAAAAATAAAADAARGGHEGVMVKALDSVYEAGRRGVGWIKVKPTHTLDLVVLAVEWGSGRRRGWLSNLHLGARDPDSGQFVMLGKTFKGLTDQMLEWQTARFLQLETKRERHVVHVRPEQVVEIAFDDVQRSSRYPGGMALRFARVKGYRQDKSAAEADTVATVRAIGIRSGTLDDDEEGPA